MKLNPVTEKFILHWGEMGTKWGVNRTVAQIHALLYIIGKPLPADEIVETLGVARSNVSNSIKELQNLQLVQTVHILGDRRDHFTTSADVWTLFRTIVEVRQRREIEPTLHFLQELMDSPEFAHENETAKQRIRQTHDFIGTLTAWTNEMLRLPVTVMSKVLKLGAGIQKLLR
ncbi:MarR family transcriptional regulator [Conchiformibius steedae DSM 2580]|uniref:HTH-type transcriptional regulator n=2 Tax=Conchiformibius steedae TaxID=153493 RepID=A0A3P2A443_9NEIS|nr:MarR family transcriptional regulator [Conchiformibius steedae]QMT33510.1 MarR family transcriptional regulator [Conchiformibius steedae]RRD89745.1 MarR family transcriptional regulator [Conchiformibius steedae]URD68168.1 MarR family transcriptional regulator [Conchiformibius steedae DSM 2580]